MESYSMSCLIGKDDVVTTELTIHSSFEKLLDQRPELNNKIAIKDSSSTITFQQLSDESTKMSFLLQRYIMDRSLMPNQDGDSIIAVCLQPSVAEIVTLLAILKTGAAYLPLDASFPEDRVTHILKDSQPMILITSKEITKGSSFASTSFPSLVLYVEDVIKEVLSNDHFKIASSNDALHQSPAVVLYTSGSTGIPKGVRLLHRSIVHRLQWQWKQYPYEREEICCAKTTRSFGDSTAEIWGPLLQGVPIVIVEKETVQNPEVFVPLLEENKITRLVLVPSLLAALLRYLGCIENGQNRLMHLRLWICSGEALSQDLILQFFDYFSQNTHKLCNFYGCTEVTADATFAEFLSKEQAVECFWMGKVPLGKPLDNCQIYLFSHNGDSLVNPGESGEIFLAGELLAGGYVNNREGHRFRNVTIDNVTRRMFQTGDIGRVVNGTLYFEGRFDSQIKIRGFKVDLEEIKIALQSIDCVRSVSVLFYGNGTSEQHIVAFVETNFPADEKYIRKCLQTKLMYYMVPKVVLVDTIPLLVSGKTDRQGLMEKYKKMLQKEAASVSCLENNESLPPNISSHFEVLLKCMKSVMGASLPRRISFSDNYFEIGGSSLDAVTVVMKLREHGYKLSLQGFASASNFASLVTDMEALVHKEQNNQVPQCNRGQNFHMEKLQDYMQSDVVRLVATSFSTKEPLSVCLGVTYEEHAENVTAFWQYFIDSNISFVMKSGNGNIVAACLSVAGSPQPQIDNIPRFSYVLEYLDYVDKLAGVEYFIDNPEMMKIGRPFLMTTETSCDSSDNVWLMQQMEGEVVRQAMQQNYNYLIVENINELTKYLCVDVNGYELHIDNQVNTFIASDGTQPFAELPDSVRCTVCLKKLPGSEVKMKNN